MELTVHFIHAFTASVFQGNAAAVIITKAFLSDDVMQKIATENNVSETAFVVKNDQGTFDIRWFSPLSEIDFCGHATLASAYVLFKSTELSLKEGLKEHSKQSLQQRPTICFYAKAVGDIHVQYTNNGMIEMRFPNYKPSKVMNVPDALIQGLSIAPCEVFQNQQAYFAIYEKASDVSNICSNSHVLTSLAPYDVVVTAPADIGDYDFVSRYFWPANGGDEDPVTGSAHAGLVPYWAEQLNKNELNAYQASSRGGHLKCRLSGAHVFVAGFAVPYLIGTIYIP